MNKVSDDRCGYTWPEDFDVDDDPNHQSCCWRPTPSDADFCVWHAEAVDAEKKTIDALQKTRPDPEIREQTEPHAELLDGAVLANCEIGNSLSLSNVSLRRANLNSANLRYTDFSETSLQWADLGGADLTETVLAESVLINANLEEAKLGESDLTDASLLFTDLTGAFLNDAILTNTDLRFANLTEAVLSLADLTNANLSEADLTRANLFKADLTDASLYAADLTDADLFQANVSAQLERANLTRSGLFFADLRGAEFHAAVTTDTQINEDTRFGNHYVSDQGSVSPEDSQKARWCARTIEQIAEDNALPDTAREAFLTRKRRRRNEASNEGKWGTWIHLTVSGLLMGYGESFKRVLLSAAVVILTATFLYPWLGVKPEGGLPLMYPPFTPDAPVQFATAVIDTLLTSGYFSVLTFTTLGFGDLRPVGFGRVIATAEAGFGVTLFALFVFVLGRRATR